MGKYYIYVFDERLYQPLIYSLEIPKYIKISCINKTITKMQLKNEMSSGSEETFFQRIYMKG